MLRDSIQLQEVQSAWVYEFPNGTCVNIGYTLRNKEFLQPVDETTMCINGLRYKYPIFISNCVIDFSSCSEETGYMLSICNNAEVIFDNCIFTHGYHGIRIGSEDTLDHSKVAFMNCVFSDIGSMCDVYNKSQVLMYNTKISNWSSTKYTVSLGYGIYVHTGGSIEINKCEFIQNQSADSHLCSNIVNQAIHQFITGVKFGSHGLLSGIYRCLRHPKLAFTPGVFKAILKDPDTNVVIKESIGGK